MTSPVECWSLSDQLGVVCLDPKRYCCAQCVILRRNIPMCNIGCTSGPSSSSPSTFFVSVVPFFMSLCGGVFPVVYSCIGPIPDLIGLGELPSSGSFGLIHFSSTCTDVHLDALGLRPSCFHWVLSKTPPCISHMGRVFSPGVYFCVCLLRCVLLSV